MEARQGVGQGHDGAEGVAPVPHPLQRAAIGFDVGGDHLVQVALGLLDLAAVAGVSRQQPEQAQMRPELKTIPWFMVRMYSMRLKSDSMRGSPFMTMASRMSCRPWG